MNPRTYNNLMRAGRGNGPVGKRNASKRIDSPTASEIEGRNAAMRNPKAANPYPKSCACGYHTAFERGRALALRARTK